MHREGRGRGRVPRPQEEAVDAPRTGAPPRGAYAKSAGRRREILRAAVEVFSEHGYRKGSLRDVAERVGMTQAGVLHHYPSKAHLLEAVLAWRDRETTIRMGDPPPEGVDHLRATVDLAAFNATTPELVELYAVLAAEATAPDHPAHEYFIGHYAHVLGSLRTALQTAAAEGELRPGIDPDSTARATVALMDGLQLQWLLDREAVDMAEELRRYLQPLLTVAL